MRGSLSIRNLIVPIIIFVSDDTVLFGTNANSFFIYLKYLVLMAVLLYLLSQRKSYPSQLTTNTMWGMCILMILSSIINSDLRLGLLYKLVILALSCFITQVYSLKEFAQNFEKFIYFLACCSIVGYSIAFFIPSFLQLFPVITNISNNDYYNLIFYSQYVNLDGVIRNAGCFRESGVFQMFLNLALIFHIYFCDSFKIKHFFVIILAIVLTFSTTGYAVFALVLFLFLLSNKSSVISKKVKYAMLFLIVVAVGIMIVKTDVFSMEGILFSKFQQDDNDSSIARISSITTNIEIWRNNPLFGSGLKIDELYSKITLSQYGLYSEHNTNTFLYELACWGVFYFIIMLFGIIKFSRRIGSSIAEHIIMFLILFMMSIGEKLVFSPFFYILIFYGYNAKACFEDSSYLNKIRK